MPDANSFKNSDVVFRTPGGEPPADGLPSITADTDAPRWRRTRAAVFHDQIIGVAVLARASATDSYFAEVTVAAPYRRRGIGTRLYSDLSDLADPFLPIMTRAMSSQPLRRQFAEHLGCTVAVHCPEPQLDPVSITTQTWIEAQQTPSGYCVVPMATLSTVDVRDAWYSYFQWAHQPSGTVRVSALPEGWDIYSPGVDPVLSRLCIQEDTGRIAALSLVSPDGWQGRTFVVSETTTRDQENGTTLLLATVAASLKEIATAGKRLVEFEGHSTDAHSPELAQSLPTTQADPLDILLLRRPDTEG